MSGGDYTAAGSGWLWSPPPWLIRAWAATVRSFGFDEARRLARTPDERAAIDAVGAIGAPAHQDRDAKKPKRP